jgi:hypothetical protein
MSVESPLDAEVRVPSDDVRVIFKGLFMAKIRETKAPEPGVAMISALKPSPMFPTPPPIAACHQPVIQVFTIDRASGVVTKIDSFISGVQNLNDFSLLVDIAQPNIVKAQTGAFNRLNDRHPKKDFRWFVDLDEIHLKRIRVNEALLTPKFTMNQGLFHTSDLSDGEVRKKLSGQPGDRFGRFAMEITALVELGAGRTAELRHGADLVFSVTKGIGPRYEVVYDARCRNNEEDSDDFRLIYEVITNISHEHPDERVSLPPDTTALQQTVAEGQFELTAETVTASPEVYCVAGCYRGEG